MKQIILGITLAMVGMVMAVPAFASFHLMQVEQIIGGVNGDPTKQAIQLRTRALGENFVSNGRSLIVKQIEANGVSFVKYDLPTVFNFTEVVVNLSKFKFAF